MKTLTLKVPDGLLSEIASEARTRNLSRSAIMRERLARKTVAVRKGQAANLWARMEDLVITTDSLPADLSTNKVALRGYGKNRSDR